MALIVASKIVQKVSKTTKEYPNGYPFVNDRLLTINRADAGPALLLYSF